MTATSAASLSTQPTGADETGPKRDMPAEDPGCFSGEQCNFIDILFVIDNSSTMREEPLNVSRKFPPIVEELFGLRDLNGNPVRPDVHLMVTTTDVGHPLCEPLYEPGYEPRAGAPVYEGCNARIERFTGLDPMDPVVLEEACTELCPEDIVPDDPFIRYGMWGSNVPNDDIAAALSCIGPQGFDGCNYPAPLEAMRRALDPAACWNDPSQPACDEDPEWAELTEGFLRHDAQLAIVLISDGADCSVDPSAYSYFTDSDEYWNVDPDSGLAQPTPAICFNAGVACDDDDGDGIYETCASQDEGVLFPVQRYVDELDLFTEFRGKDVVMLGMLGVPEVIEHSPNPPFEPVDGGTASLVHREWIDAPFPAGDITPEAWDSGRRASHEVFERGNLAPGCIGTTEFELSGHATPPVRMREVCESLNFFDEELLDTQVRCCIESICDTDYSAAIRCLSVLLEEPVHGE